MHFPDPRSNLVVPVLGGIFLLLLGCTVAWTIGHRRLTARRMVSSPVAELPEFGYPLTLPESEETCSARCPRPCAALCGITGEVFDTLVEDKIIY